MPKQAPLTNVEDLLDRLGEAAADRERVSVEVVVEAIGRRSFAPTLLVTGLIMLAPGPADLPGVPVILGLLVILTAGQLIVGRHHFWLPRWMLSRNIASETLQRVINWLRRPARHVDRLLRRRLVFLTHDWAVALPCIGVALLTPVLEFIPFSANVAGAALTAFGLSLLAHDGLLALLAFTATLGAAGLALWYLL